jgi:formamidopyrimidine-DNA glycosylase
MPELPDLVVYIDHLGRRIVGARLERARVLSPNLLRTAVPPLSQAEGQVVLGVTRLGKRIVLGFPDQLFLGFHLMISGRLHWREPRSGGPTPGGPRIRRKSLLASFEFSTGTLELTEAATKKRASLHVVQREKDLRALDPGGLEVLEASLEEFDAALRRENHTLKRALTDGRLLSAIGNAYSDEILHRAGLSPLQQTSRLAEAEIERLYAATRDTLEQWITRLRADAGEAFPEGVTAFRAGMAVHGRFRKPCPDCGAPVQRIAYADHETNYCARCQTAGRLLADRALSRLLKSDWPKTLEELEG